MIVIVITNIESDPTWSFKSQKSLLVRSLKKLRNFHILYGLQNLLADNELSETLRRYTLLRNLNQFRSAVEYTYVLAKTALWFERTRARGGINEDNGDFHPSIVY